VYQGAALVGVQIGGKLSMHIWEVAMAGQCIPGPVNSMGTSDIDDGTLCLNRTPAPHTTGVGAPVKKHTYEVTGTLGALGGMFFTDAPQRLPGEWYDHTDAVNQIRQDEVKLGSTAYASPEFKASARRTAANLKHPTATEVTIHFTKQDRVETIQVRGRWGARSFRFDFNEAEAAAEKLPEGADVLQPFNDAIDRLIALILEVRGT